MHVVELRRYAVKPMAGEPLTQATLGPDGLDGHRRGAVSGPRGRVRAGAKRSETRARRIDKAIAMLLER